MKWSFAAVYDPIIGTCVGKMDPDYGLSTTVSYFTYSDASFVNKLWFK